MTNITELDEIQYCVTINNTTYAIPAMVIAEDRATHYFNIGRFTSLEQSLTEDTIPLFLEDDMAIRDWAANNMNWADVIDSAKIISKQYVENDPQEDWCNGGWFVIDNNVDEYVVDNEKSNYEFLLP